MLSNDFRQSECRRSVVFRIAVRAAGCMLCACMLLSPNASCQATDTPATASPKKLKQITVWIVSRDRNATHPDLIIRAMVGNTILHLSDGVIHAPAQFPAHVDIDLPDKGSHPVLETETGGMRISVSAANGGPVDGKGWLLQATGLLEDNVYCELASLAEGIKIGSSYEWNCAAVSNAEIFKVEPAKDSDLDKIDVKLVPPMSSGQNPTHLWITLGKLVLAQVDLQGKSLADPITVPALLRRIPEVQLEMLSFVVGSSGPGGVGAIDSSWLQPWNGDGWSVEVIGYDKSHTNRYRLVSPGPGIRQRFNYVWVPSRK